MKKLPWNILLIEDDEDDYVFTRLLLADSKPRQFKLDWAKTYEEGIAAFRQKIHDVYLVDYRLGERDGLELVREAVEGGCTSPIILMTGQGSYSVDVEAMQAGATDYLQKEELSGPLLERTIRYAIQSKLAENLLKERSEQLSEANRQLAMVNQNLQISAAALQAARDDLEQRVQDRTRELRLEIQVRQKVEEALQKSETRFRTLAETTSSAIFILEGELIRYANPAVRFVTGYPPEEILDCPFYALAHPSYRETLMKNLLSSSLAASRAKDRPVEGSQIRGINLPNRFEIKLLTKAGAERWVDLSIGQMSLDGQPYLVVTAFDITERDLAEQALRLAKQELEKQAARQAALLATRLDELDECQEALRQFKERLDI
jgi:PAS domain S-box-containing protein